MHHSAMLFVNEKNLGGLFFHRYCQIILDSVIIDNRNYQPKANINENDTRFRDDSFGKSRKQYQEWMEEGEE